MKAQSHHDEKNEYKKGLWTAEEDGVLTDYIRVHGKGKWNRIAKETGLKRCGKSCRLRWMNYLSPAVKRGDFSEEEEDLIIRLHKLLGNRWSLIAGRVPGRTDNQVKNYWNTHLSKKLGIKKGKNKEMSVNSQSLLSEDRLEKDNCIPSGSSLSEQPNKGTQNIGDQDGVLLGDKVTGDTIGSQNSLLEGVIMSDNNYDYESSFWFSSDDDHDFMIYPKYGSYDQEQSLDFVWNIGL